MKSAEQQKGDPQLAAIRRLIGIRLKARMRDEAISHAVAAHPDEDIINAFVEGWLEESKADSLTSHLVSCASCLHMTAQLIRFDPGMDEAGSLSADADQSPLQRFFDRLASGIVPSREEHAVFAYEEKDEPADTEPDSDDPNSPR